MSTLSVHDIQGIAAYGNEIRIPSGSSLNVVGSATVGQNITIGNNLSSQSLRTVSLSHTNGTNAINIDTVGRVTMPAQPAFSAYSTNGTNITGANLKMNIYSGVTFNNGNHYNPSESRFTAPISGLYFFKGQAWLPPGVTIAGLSIRVNGNQRAAHRMSHTSSQTNYCTLTPTLIWYLNQNDYVELYTSTDGGTIHPSSGEVYSNFSGYFLR